MSLWVPWSLMVPIIEILVRGGEVERERKEEIFSLKSRFFPGILGNRVLYLVAMMSLDGKLVISSMYKNYKLMLYNYFKC